MLNVELLDWSVVLKDKILILARRIFKRDNQKHSIIGSGSMLQVVS